MPKPPHGCQLYEAWMTSFEQPDASLLVEHMLPSLLRTNHSLSQDLQERNLFFGELGTALERLRDRLTVISSPSLGDRTNARYPWLWRYVSHFSVGSKGRAVQHAKLWAFHWKPADGQAEGNEVLELFVSSTNLTFSAFRNQLQAICKLTIPLADRYSQARQRTWGILIPFLEALGVSAGTVALSRLKPLISLLGRAECPSDITFVASIPGRDSAARQLAKFQPSEIHIVTPTIGEWDQKSVSAWAAEVGVGLDKIHLKWISEDHPWASSMGWSLSKPTADVLKSSISFERLPSDARFTREHEEGDERWSHAKLYLLRGKKRKLRHLLVTSANWSTSAWGAGFVKPKNFELGVLLETDWTDLEKVGTGFGSGAVCFTSHEDRHKPENTLLQWAEGSWDGKCIKLQARSSDARTPINALVSFADEGEERRIQLVNGTASIRWNNATRTPLTARFAQQGESMEINVLDLRPISEFAKTPLPEVDPADEQNLRLGFLLQRYSGQVVDYELISRLRSKTEPKSDAASSADYTVPTWIEARAAFNLLDTWRKALEDAVADASRHERVRMDGEELQSYFASRDGPGDGLVAEEFGWRLNGEP